MRLISHNACRVCGSSALTPVIDLGQQYLQGAFIKQGKQPPYMGKIPTLLVRCDPSRDENACGLLQMAHTVPSEILYSEYWYRSGTNQTMRDHLKGIADEARAMVAREYARVLDIGCNDGTLLNHYPDKFIKYGIDPSDAAPSMEGNITVIRDIFPSEQLTMRTEGKLFDIVTSIAMFYDLEDPVGFVKCVKQCLADRGLWIFEMSYMPSMLRQNSYDTICHEHLEYYSLAVLENILQRAEMKMVRASLNSINGGSIRCYATHSTNNDFNSDVYGNSLEMLRQEERAMLLDTDTPYKKFQERINVCREELTALLHTLKSSGKRIHVYGASTKGNTILQWCGIDNTIIDYAADRNPDKHGACTLGSNIPIISEEASRALKPDYYLVLPWHFKAEFLERERKRSLLDQGIGMIFPLPVVEIVTR